MKYETATNFVVLTPNSNADVPGGFCEGLEVLTDGDLSFTALGGGNSGTIAVTAGKTFPVKVKRILAATTASVAGYY